LDGGLNVIQLETAVGAAIKSFENSLGINVPRSRFLPVKTTSDLLLVMSNLYSLNAGSLTMSEKREFPTVPLVKLGSSFTKVGNWKDTWRIMFHYWLCMAPSVVWFEGTDCSLCSWSGEEKRML
jgi:UDP-N-acetylglucosamine pyrophosphorylase